MHLLHDLIIAGEDQIYDIVSCNRIGYNTGPVLRQHILLLGDTVMFAVSKLLIKIFTFAQLHGKKSILNCSLKVNL